MNINENTLRTTASALAQLDLTEENARIAELETSIADMERAIERGRVRHAEIGEMLADSSEPDGGVVADALLSDIAVQDAVAKSRSTDELEHERKALQAGLFDLRQRSDAAGAEIKEVKSAAEKRATAIVKPLADEIADEARQAGEQILECWAALETLGRATRGVVPGRRETANALHHGLLIDHGLLRRRSSVPVPSEIVEVLEGLAGKGAALPAKARSSISM